MLHQYGKKIQFSAGCDWWDSSSLWSVLIAPVIFPTQGMVTQKGLLHVPADGQSFPQSDSCYQTVQLHCQPVQSQSPGRKSEFWSGYFPPLISVLFWLEFPLLYFHWSFLQPESWPKSHVHSEFIEICNRKCRGKDREQQNVSQMTIKDRHKSQPS